MPDTESTNLKLLKPEVGGSATTWGGKLNEDMDKIDAWATEDRKANLAGLQTGADASTITKFDGTNIPLDDDLLRTATKPLYYAEAVTIDEFKPTTLVSQAWVKDLIDLVIPVRSIIMWGGLESDIPDGWLLCNGQAVPGSSPSWSVPDLRGRMILGGYLTTDTLPTGGAEMVIGHKNANAGDFSHKHQIDIDNTILSRLQIPPHVHDAIAPATAFIARKDGGTWDLNTGTLMATAGMTGGNIGAAGNGTGNAAGHNHTVGNNTGNSAVNSTPGVPWFALAYIMKVKAWGE